MGDSIKSYYDNLEYEKYQEEIKQAKRKVDEFSHNPHEYADIIKDLKGCARDIEQYGTGKRGLWSTVDNLIILIKRLDHTYIELTPKEMKTK